MGDSARPDWTGRQRRTWRAAPVDSLAAFVVSAPANVTYLTGFTGSAASLVLTETTCRLIVDGRYGRAVREALERGDIAPVEVEVADGPLEQALTALLSACPPGPVAFEAEHVSVAAHDRWRRAVPGRALVPTAGWVESLRAVKDDWELATMRRACLRLSAVARGLGSWVAAGRTEREVAGDIDAALRQAGFARLAFDTIVASGPNGALPHARPTNRRIRLGDLVLLDFGGVLDGYCGDLARTVGVGRVGAEARDLFEAVRAAQGAALAAVRAQALASEVDAAARRVLTSHGFGEAVRHATGHGLGLEVHEAPRIGRATGDRVERLAAGMVCTIEPGAYVDGVGGVRLEDDVVVTAEGCEVLTDAPRDLLLV